MGALRASGASRWPLPEPLEPRDSCSQSLWSLEIAAPRAPGASRSCSQSLWSLQEAAPRASGASRWLMPRGNSRGDGRRSFEALRRHLARKHYVISAATNQQVNTYIYIYISTYVRNPGPGALGSLDFPGGQGLGSRGQGSGARSQGSGARSPGSGARIQGSGGFSSRFREL